MKQQNHVLFCILNWGLGHATRCLPIVKEFQNRGYRVSIASDGRAQNLLQRELPQLSHHTLTSYGVVYPFKSMLLNLLIQWPRIAFAMTKEHFEVRRLVRESSPDLIISDNRYGCFVEGMTNIFITHQINPPTSVRIFDRLARWMSDRMLDRFSTVWIPDDPGLGYVTGKLVDNPPDHARFVGLLSRFNHYRKERDKQRDILVILSGPEPQRTRFEKKITRQLLRSDHSFLIVRGRTEMTDDIMDLAPRGQVVETLNSTELETAIRSSRMILSRCGYTTVMDFMVLGVPALLVPTPGQYEQEYIASRVSGPNFVVQEETHLNIATAFSQLAGLSGRPYLGELLTKAVDGIQDEE